MIQDGAPVPTKISQTWQSLLLSRRRFLTKLYWNIDNKSTEKIILDILSGMDGPHPLSFILISFPHGVNIQVLKDITVSLEESSFKSHWLNAHSPNIPKKLAPKWTFYIDNIQFFGIVLSQEEENLIWKGGFYIGPIILKQVYQIIS